MFTGCSSDDDVIKGNGNGTQNVYLKINLPAMGSANSRVISDPIANDEALQIATLTLAFTDGGNRVMLAKALTTAEITKATAANDSVEINNVSADATKVFAIANSNVTIADGDVINTNNFTINAGDESDADAINIYGEGTITPKGAKDGDSYVNITVYPTVSRFEVTDVTADGIFESFDVTGIYVDGFYTSARVNGDFLASVDNIKELTTDNSKYGTEYDPTWEGAIYNEGIWSTDATGNAVAGASKVWGYYVFATPRTTNTAYDFSQDPAAGVGSAAPRIILKIENIKVDPTKGSAEQIATYEGQPWYVTAKSFNISTAGVASATTIKSIVSGYVIRTAPGMFKVNENNVHPNPNVGDVTVDVNITPLKWKGIEVVPNTK
jgi:hypothetical protein